MMLYTLLLKNHTSYGGLSLNKGEQIIGVYDSEEKVEEMVALIKSNPYFDTSKNINELRIVMFQPNWDYSGYSENPYIKMTRDDKCTLNIS